MPISIATSAPPAVTVWDNEIYVVFKSSADQTMWVSSSSNGFTWTLHQLPLSATTLTAPTVSVLNNQLHVLYKSSGDNTIWQVNSVDGINWTSPIQLPQPIAIAGRARGWNKVAAYGGFWSFPGLPGAAIDNKNNLLFAWTDNANNLKLLYPSGGSIPVTINVGSVKGSPSIVYANGSFYVFWRSFATGQLYFGILNDPNDLTQGFGLTQALGGAFSTDGPQVTLAGSVIYVAWRGTGSDEQLYSGYLSNLTGTPTWSGVSLFVTTSAFNSSFSPAVGANQAGIMYTAWKGVPSDLRLFFARNLDFASSSYQPGSTLNTANGTQLLTDDRPSLGAIRSGSSTGSLVVTYTLAGGMYYTINDYSGSTLSSWTNQAQIPTPGLPNPEGLLVTNPSQAGSSLYLLVGDRDGSGLMVNALYLYEFLTD